MDNLPVVFTVQLEVIIAFESCLLVCCFFFFIALTLFGPLILLLLWKSSVFIRNTVSFLPELQVVEFNVSPPLAFLDVCTHVYVKIIERSRNLSISFSHESGYSRIG